MTLLTKYLAKELASEISQSDQNSRTKVGKHWVNGEKRYVVHVTYKPGEGTPYTVARLT